MEVIIQFSGWRLVMVGGGGPHVQHDQGPAGVNMHTHTRNTTWSQHLGSRLGEYARITSIARDQRAWVQTKVFASLLCTLVGDRHLCL